MARPVPSPRDRLLDRWTGLPSLASCGDEVLHKYPPMSRPPDHNAIILELEVELGTDRERSLMKCLAAYSGSA